MTGRRSTEQQEEASGQPDERSARLDLHAVNGERPAVDRLRVIIADPDPLARRAIRDSLRIEGAFLVAAEAKDGLEAVELAVHYRPDARAHGDCAARRRRDRRMPRDHDARPDGARGDVLGAPGARCRVARTARRRLGIPLQELRASSHVARALRSVAEGEAAVTRSLTSHLVDLLRSTAENGTGMRPVKSPLTTREWEVLDLICAGDSTRDISAKLFLSEDTVYSHTKSILRKLGVHSRVDAVAMAAQMRQPATRLSAPDAGVADRLPPIDCALNARRHRRTRLRRAAARGRLRAGRRRGRRRRRRPAQDRGDRRAGAPTSRTSPTRRSRRCAGASRRPRTTHRSRPATRS